MPTFKVIAESISLAVDAVGVMIIVLGLVWAVGRFCLSRPLTAPARYRQVRQDVGRGILLGLEFLVAADIIRTVAVDPTLENVSTLGVIVVIRTFLSMALQVELEGRWPWQPATARNADIDRGPAA